MGPTSAPGVPACGPSHIRLSAGTQGSNEHNMITLIVIDSRQGSCTLSVPTQLSIVAPGVEHTVEVGKLPATMTKRLVLGPRHYGSIGVGWGNWCGTSRGVSVQIRFGARQPPWSASIAQPNVPICGSSTVSPAISLNGWGYEMPLASGVYAGVPSFPKGFASQTSVIPE